MGLIVLCSAAALTAAAAAAVVVQGSGEIMISTMGGPDGKVGRHTQGQGGGTQ
jgi:hypothetical protein